MQLRTRMDGFGDSVGITSFGKIRNFLQKESLDLYFPERPVCLVNAEAHGVWANSRALEIAGVTRDTPDPFGGEIARDENGEPTGFFYESASGLITKTCFCSPEEEKTNYP